MYSMKYCLLVLSLFCFLLSCTNPAKEHNSGNNTENGSELFEVLGDKVDKIDFENGLQQWIVYKKDVLIEEGEVLNNRKTGTWLEFYPNGFIKTSTSYYKNAKNGTYLLFSNRGSLQERHYYKNGQLDGKKLKYTLSKIVLDEDYVKGQLNGKRILYYDDGTIQEEGNFKDGKRHGNQKWYDQEGKVSIEYDYENGEKIEE